MVTLLPELAICQLVGTLQSFQLRESTFIASYIFGKSSAVSSDTIYYYGELCIGTKQFLLVQ